MSYLKIKLSKVPPGCVVIYLTIFNTELQFTSTVVILTGVSLILKQLLTCVHEVVKHGFLYLEIEDSSAFREILE